MMRDISWIPRLKFVALGLLIVSLISVPVVVDAHWYGGGAIFGFGAGLLTGYLFAPRPVYVAPPPAPVYAPPVYVAPPPGYNAPPPGYAPPPPPGPDASNSPSAPPAPGSYNVPPPSASGPPDSGYSDEANAAPPVTPGRGPTCREWKLIERHMVNHWDSYYRKWRQVPSEKWGWAEVPCNK